MPRSMWKGAVSFGMVSIPIKLYTATDSKDVSFNLLHGKCHTRIKQQRYCPACDVVVEWNDVVRGYEYGPDNYVVMEESDFEKVPVSTTRTIDITQFVQLDEVDPIHYDRSYYLEPDAVGVKPFALLRETLMRTGRVALAKVSLRQKEQLCILRPYANTLALETMYYPDEIRSTEELTIPGEETTVSDRELDMARSLVDMLTAEFDPSQYRDEYRQALLGVIEKKAAGQEVARPKAAVGKVTDLMEALRASIEATKKERAATEEVEKRRARRAAV